MRQGFRVIDADTHVNPTLDALLEHADKSLLDRQDELAPYVRKTKPRTGNGDPEDLEEYSTLLIDPVRYNRVAGQKPPAPSDASQGGAGFLSVRTHMKTRWPITSGTGDRNSKGRLQDMDTEGRDIDFIIPGPWAFSAPALERELSRGLYRAYHRYMAEYCSPDPRRLKGLIVVSGADPDEGAKVIREHANEDWVAAVWPNVPLGLPIDDPDLEPIWKAAAEFDLPIMYHGFTVAPPYFPGYQDVWENPAMGRCAGQTWGGQRFISFMLMSGILDRYPDMRIGLMECGHGWLPHWLLRLTRQIDYVRGSVPDDLKHTPVEYAQMDRLFCGIDYSEGLAMTKAVVDLIGNAVLMYQSDYPHPETLYPDHVDTVVAWREELGESTMNKLMWENAARFFRLSTTPWS